MLKVLFLRTSSTGMQLKQYSYGGNVVLTFYLNGTETLFWRLLYGANWILTGILVRLEKKTYKWRRAKEITVELPGPKEEKNCQEITLELPGLNVSLKLRRSNRNRPAKTAIEQDVHSSPPWLSSGLMKMIWEGQLLENQQLVLPTAA